LKIAIIGLGLIGGSLGLIIKKKLKDIIVLGVDINPEIINKALSKGAIDKGTTDLNMVDSCDVVFISTYPSQVKDIVKGIKDNLKPGAIVTDVSSIKGQLIEEIPKLLPSEVYFIGGHPMAGSEINGIEGATEILFENAIYCLTPPSNCPNQIVERLFNLIQDIGALPKIINHKDHDLIVAAVSHLPHLVASALVNTAVGIDGNKREVFQLAAGGFKDTTRVASGSPGLWRDILITNKDNVVFMINSLKKNLEEIKDFILNEDKELLEGYLNEAKIHRDNLPSYTKGVLPSLNEVFINIPDTPGAIGEIATLLGGNDVNIDDIEITRARDRGTLRLGFKLPNDKAKAYKILKDKNYDVKDKG
jgi:prephenate dehydrogenase